MPRTTINAQVAPGCYPTLPVVADSLDLLMTAADVANKNQTECTGKEMILAENTGGSPFTVTISSAADGKLRRTGDIGPYTLAAGEKMLFGPIQMDGFRQAADGQCYFEGSNAGIKFAVIRLP